jgi:hypothetical protein
MGLLDGVKPISELGQRKLVVLWGKSNTGKTALGATWPKPMLYVQIGDDGANTISDVEGIDSLRIETTKDLKDLLKEASNKKKFRYKTVFLDTFSMYTNVWVDENAVQKNKKMTQQLWGDLKTDTEEVVRLAHKLALRAWVILSCHEAMDTVDGMEEEILPDARPNMTKGARTYLEGMANYGFHTTRLKKEVIVDGVEKELVKYAAHIGPNPYYWTKIQAPKGTKIPGTMTNPSFSKLKKLGIVGGDNNE